MCLTVLSISPNDEDAIRCKIVALIKNDSIDEALATVVASRRIQIDLSFFKVIDRLSVVPNFSVSTMLVCFSCRKFTLFGLGFEGDF